MEETEKKYLSVPFKLDETKMLEQETGYFKFEGWASTFDSADLDNDVIAQGAFTNSIKKRMPKLLWQHHRHEPLGIFTTIEVAKRGLHVMAKMPMADTFVSGRVKPQIEIGAINSMSIGFCIIEETYNRESCVRTIHELELFEISLVSIPANPEAVITDFKNKKVGALTVVAPLSERDPVKELDNFLEEIKNKEAQDGLDRFVASLKK